MFEIEEEVGWRGMEEVGQRWSISSCMLDPRNRGPGGGISPFCEGEEVCSTPTTEGVLVVEVSSVREETVC